MVDIAALMYVLPVSGLQPQWVASIAGFVEVAKDHDWQERIWLLEPPAGQRVPYIEPVGALEQLLRSQGVAPEHAREQVRKALARMKIEVRADRWVNFFDSFDSESPDCLPLPDFVAWLRNERRRANQLPASEPKLKVERLGAPATEEMLVPLDVLEFLDEAGEVAARTPMFRGPDNWHKPWSLKNVPPLPPPKAMIEFVPGAPWTEIDDPDESEVTTARFLQWREAIRPVALELEAILREPVYHFADQNSEEDDDDVHRFLVLHWCCTHRPESAFVRYLLKTSGARDVEELKAALIDSGSYIHPFKMNDAFIGVEAVSCQFDYLPPDAHKTVAVVFSTLEARDVAQSLLAQKVGARALIVAPKELATDEWVTQATRRCQGWTMQYYTLDEPIRVLALADELLVIANEQTVGSGFDLNLSQGAEDLLWLALDFGVQAEYFHVDGRQLANPESSLQRRGAPERVAARKAQRSVFTRELKEIRIYNDYGSSGLWEDGNLSYELLDLPFPLVRQIARWQQDFDDTVTPPDRSSKQWWERHEQEEVEIAKALQAALGSEIVVKVSRSDRWLSVAQSLA